MSMSDNNYISINKMESDLHARLMPRPRVGKQKEREEKQKEREEKKKEPEKKKKKKKKGRKRLSAEEKERRKQAREQKTINNIKSRYNVLSNALSRLANIDAKKLHILDNQDKKYYQNKWRAVKMRTRRILDSYIKKSDINSLLKLRIDSNSQETDYFKLTPTQLKKLISGENKIFSDSKSKYVLEIVVEDEKFPQQFTLRGKTVEKLKNILSHSRVLLEKNEQVGSDKLDQIVASQITGARIREIKKPDQDVKIFQRNGGFFKQILSINLDLSRYQIYTKEQLNEIKTINQCLIHCLELSGVERKLIHSLIESLNPEIKKHNKYRFNISTYSLLKIAEKIRQQIILYKKDTKHKTRFTKYPKTIPENWEEQEPIKIALYDNHYFLYEDTKYTSYSVKHYDDVKDLKNFHNICEFNRKDKLYKRKRKTARMNSLDLVHYLKNEGKFVDDAKLLYKLHKNQEKSNYFEYCLDNVDDEQREFSSSDMDIPDLNKIFFADCESFVNGPYNELYLLGVVNYQSDDVKIFNTCDDRNTRITVMRFLNFVTNRGTQNARVYFHNLKYDYNILEKYFQKIIRKISNGSTLYSVTIMFKMKKVELWDSYKIINTSLRDFNKMLDLPPHLHKKEAISYNYYTRKNNNKKCSKETYRQLLSNKEQKIFDENTHDIKSGEFNPLEYYKEYLRLDCLVLKEGLVKFSKIINVIGKGSVCMWSCRTISKIGFEMATKNNCFKDCYEISGSLRSYVSKACIGGRVFVNPKFKKKVLLGKMADGDARSLYPSSMFRLKIDGLGFPKGKCKKFPTPDLYNWRTKDYCVLTIKILKVNKFQQIPSISYKCKKTGIRIYTNEPPNSQLFIIDKLTLEEWVKHHKIDFEIIDGIYWDNGFNQNISDYMSSLYNRRNQAKRDKNKALSNILKLLMNSTYGKTIVSQKFEKISFKNSHKWVKEEKNNGEVDWILSPSTDVQRYLFQNFETIVSVRKINDTQVEVISEKRDEDFNLAQCGAIVLSMSKRIMDEVLSICNEKEFPVYYTDTDSIHLRTDDLTKLSGIFKERFGRELEGENLGQFHDDFDLKGGDDSEVKTFAKRSIFLGPKSYIDHVVAVDRNCKELKEKYHVRLKGITSEGIEDATKKFSNMPSKYEKNIFGLFNYLADGHEWSFVLNPYNKEENSKKQLFDISNGRVRFRDEFIRKIKF